GFGIGVTSPSLMLIRLRVCKGWSRDDRKRLAYLAIFTGYIEGRKYSTPTRVSLARLVMELERFENYPWGRVAFKVLMDSVKGRDISGCYTINGFAQALQQLWLLSTLPKDDEDCGRNAAQSFKTEQSGNWKILENLSYLFRLEKQPSLVLWMVRSKFGGGDYLLLIVYLWFLCLESVRFDVFIESVSMIKNDTWFETELPKGKKAVTITSDLDFDYHSLHLSFVSEDSYLLEPIWSTTFHTLSRLCSNLTVSLLGHQIHLCFTSWFIYDLALIHFRETDLSKWLSETTISEGVDVAKSSLKNSTAIAHRIADHSHWEEVRLHIDAWINVLRQRYQENPQAFRSERMCFLDHNFSQSWREQYQLFKTSEPDHKGLGRVLPGGASNFHDGSIPSFCQSNKKWGEDIDDIYAPVNLDDKHWVAIWISIPKRHIVVWDSIPSSSVLDAWDAIMEPFLQMVPYLLVECAATDEIRVKYGLEPYTYERPLKGVPTANNGDCGVYAVKYIECHALGVSFDPKDFARCNAKK
ncbi:unnamed protein product, partial [Brassica oleracea var. botrytis]